MVMPKGGYVAIGTIDHLTKGWAQIPFRGRMVHYWIERNTSDMPMIFKGGRVRFYKSLCGIEAETDIQRPAIVPGNFPRCKRCARMVRNIG